MAHRIAVIAGDNVGPEVIREGLKVLRKVESLGMHPSSSRSSRGGRATI